VVHTSANVWVYRCNKLVNLELSFYPKCLVILLLVFENLMVDFGFENIIYKSVLESLEFITIMNIFKTYFFLMP
jgi:hypothetical protein